MLPSIKVIIYKYRSTLNNEYPLMLRITQNRKSKYLSIGISSKLELWNEKEGLPKKKHSLYSEIITTINNFNTKINKEALNLYNQEKEVNLDKLIAILQPNKVSDKIEVLKPKQLFEYIEEVRVRLEKANRIGYANTFRSLKNSLKTENPTISDIALLSIDVNFLNEYETNMLSRGIKLNSVAVHMRTFRVLMNNARKEKIVPKSFYPFEDFSFNKYNNIKTTKRAIPKEDIQKIVNYQSIPNSKLHLAQQIFLFSFYCRGINFTDIAFLTWENVHNNRLSYRRKKTKEMFNIELLEPAKDILNYYKINHFQGEKGYIFPILNKEIHITAIQIDYRIERMIGKVNKSLKELAKEIGIETNLTTYVARHSFATIQKSSGTPIAVISELMGHTSEKTTRIYLKDFENSLLDEASKAIL